MRTKPSITSETAWRAVFRKDRHYDGRFVYGAATTGIYCRPSCPARNPKRRNTRIFCTVDDAERRGYVACLRCHPNSLAPAEESIQAVLQYVEAHLDQPMTLRNLSQIARLSPHHLQQVFKKIVGVSPKAFCDTRRVARFKQHLRAGQSIAAACYEVGYGSSRALYERTKRSMGMTPSVYRRGGDGVRIRYSIAKVRNEARNNSRNKSRDRSRDYAVLIATTTMGLCAVLSGGKAGSLIRDLRDEFPKAQLRHQSPAKLKSAMHSCRIKDPMLSRLALDLRSRIFQARVWNILSAANS
jgi:AraC family transcriptional regulator of adaptative response/methylated-DNA-[protein]-cysteine methyltransferase